MSVVQYVTGGMLGGGWWDQAKARWLRLRATVATLGSLGSCKQRRERESTSNLASLCMLHRKPPEISPEIC